MQKIANTFCIVVYPNLTLMSENNTLHYNEDMEHIEWCRNFERQLQRNRVDRFWKSCYGYMLDRITIMYLFVHKKQPHLPLLDVDSARIVTSYLYSDWVREKINLVWEMEEWWKEEGWKYDDYD